MAKPGPKPKPNLQVVKEGNPQNRSQDKLERGLRLPPATLVEPDWELVFPAVSDVVVPRKARAETAEQTRAREDAAALRRFQLAEQKLARGWASEEWRRVVGVLNAHGTLADIDHVVLMDYAVCWARIIQCERDVSRHGLRQRGERGWQRNGSITSAKAYRDQLKFYVGELGLSPVARDGFAPTGDLGGAGDAAVLGWDA